jgi:hypothetical protein
VPDFQNLNVFGSDAIERDVAPLPKRDDELPKVAGDAATDVRVVLESLDRRDDRAANLERSFGTGLE